VFPKSYGAHRPPGSAQKFYSRFDPRRSIRHLLVISMDTSQHSVDSVYDVCTCAVLNTEDDRGPQESKPGETSPHQGGGALKHDGPPQAKRASQDFAVISVASVVSVDSIVLRAKDSASLTGPLVTVMLRPPRVADQAAACEPSVVAADHAMTAGGSQATR
jgi:hypothetical protein